MNELQKFIKGLTASQKSTLLYIFIKRAIAKNIVQIKQPARGTLKRAFESKKHGPVFTEKLYTRLHAAFVIDAPDGGQSFTYKTYKTMVEALRNEVTFIGRMRDKFNKITQARINWKMYADAKRGNLRDDFALDLSYSLDCYVSYTTAKRELHELEAAVGAGAYSQFTSNKLKLPRAVRTAVKSRLGTLRYAVESWKEFAGLLDGEATAPNAKDRKIDWSIFRDYDAQEFVYYSDLGV